MKKLTETIRDRIRGKLPHLVLFLFILQPLMDILSFWVVKWGISNTITLLLRLVVLAVTLLLGFVLSHKRKVYYIALAVFLFIGAGHIFACLQYGYQNIVTDLSNYVRVLQLPITVLCLITFMREDEGCYGAMKKGIVLNILIILFCQVLAIVTGTEPHTYDDGAGFIGWFSNTNTQSSILTMASPVAAVWLYQKKGFHNVWFWIAIVGSCLSMFFIGTRLAYAGIIAMCFGIGMTMLLTKKKLWRSAVVFILVGVLFVTLLPFAPMMGHRMGHKQEMEQKQGWLNVALQNPENDNLPEPEPDKEPALDWGPLEVDWQHKWRVQRLAPVYEHYVSDFVEVFGLDRTVWMMDYTEDITKMTNVRDKKLMVAEALMDISPASAKIFGIELGRFTIKGHIFDVENDFHGIYYLYGIVGLAALLLFILYFVWLIVKALFKNFCRFFTEETAAWGIGLIMCLGHCYTTAGVLRRPSASFYMAAILAAVYFLVKVKKYPEKAEV